MTVLLDFTAREALLLNPQSHVQLVTIKINLGHQHVNLVQEVIFAQNLACLNHRFVLKVLYVTEKS